MRAHAAQPAASSSALPGPAQVYAIGRESVLSVAELFPASLRKIRKWAALLALRRDIVRRAKLALISEGRVIESQTSAFDVAFFEASDSDEHSRNRGQRGALVNARPGGQVAVRNRPAMFDGLEEEEDGEQQDEGRQGGQGVGPAGGAGTDALAPGPSAWNALREAVESSQRAQQQLLEQQASAIAELKREVAGLRHSLSQVGSDT